MTFDLGDGLRLAPLGCTMKKWLFAMAPVLLAIALHEGSASAEEVVLVESSRPTLGVGAILGDPTAIGIKLRLADYHALQLSAGWAYVDAPVSRLTVMGDYLVHFVPFQPRTASAGIL